MRNFANWGFVVTFGGGVLMSYAALLGLVSLGTAIWLFVAAVIISGFHPGDKTKLQLLFLALGTALAVSIVGFALNPWLWAVVALCTFMVMTMKLDGGD